MGSPASRRSASTGPTDQPATQRGRDRDAPTCHGRQSRSATGKLPRERSKKLACRSQPLPGCFWKYSTMRTTGPTSGQLLPCPSDLNAPGTPPAAAIPARHPVPAYSQCPSDEGPGSPSGWLDNLVREPATARAISLTIEHQDGLGDLMWEEAPPSPKSRRPGQYTRTVSQPGTGSRSELKRPIAMT